MWVSETTNNIPNTIFVYQDYPDVANSGNLPEYFVHIASYADILDFPEEARDKITPFFRKGYIDLTFNSLATLDEKVTLMLRQIKLLVEDIVRLNNLPPVEVVVISL